MKVKNNAFGKSQDHNTAMPRQKNVNKLKVSGKKSSQKNRRSSNNAFLTKA